MTHQVSSQTQYSCRHGGLLALVFALTLGLGLFTQPALAAGGGALRAVRTTYPNEWNIPYPAGIAYIEANTQFLLVNRHMAEQWTPGGISDRTPQRIAVAIVTPFENYVATVQFDLALGNAINIAFDNYAHRLFVLDMDARLAQLEVGKDGLPDPATLVWHDLAKLGVGDVRGMAVDPTGQFLYLLDSTDSAVLRVRLADLPGLEDVDLSRIPLSLLAARDLRGLGVHPANGHLFTLSQARQLVYELSPSGRLLAEYAVDRLDLSDPQGLILAPSPDLTDAPDEVHLFIADSNLPERAPWNISELPGASDKRMCSGATRAGALAPAASQYTPDNAHPHTLNYGEIVEAAFTRSDKPHGSQGTSQR